MYKILLVYQNKVLYICLNKQNKYIMKTTNSKIKELCENLPSINTENWNWEWEEGCAYIKTEEEIKVYDDKDNDYYFLVKLYLARDYEFIIDVRDIEIISAYDKDSYEITLTDYQHDTLVNEIVTLIQ
jgi:hypothetical protein